MTLSEYAAVCHAANTKWWTDAQGNRLERDKGELIALMHSEVSEAMEGERKGLKDDKLPHRPMAEVELVDALIRMFDYAGAFGYQLVFAREFQLSADGACLSCGAIHAEPTSLNEAAAAALKRVPLPENKGRALAWIHKAISNLFTAETETSDISGPSRLNKAVLVILAYAAKHGYDLDGAFTEKMAYNATRADHAHEARAQQHGKKW